MAKVNLKKAKFYCESCGAEVPQNAKFCGTCGKFFTFVRCPNCYFSGDSKIFTNGCPKCGYAFHSSGEKNKKNKSLSVKKNKKVHNNGDSSLPLWIYIAVTLALIAVIFGLYSCM